MSTPQLLDDHQDNIASYRHAFFFLFTQLYRHKFLYTHTHTLPKHAFFFLNAHTLTIIDMHCFFFLHTHTLAIDMHSFFFLFQGTYTLSRKIVRNRAVSSYRIVCVCKKKNLCPEWDLNCCSPAWRSELLPTGLLGSVNKC